ncbi:MAG: hypothetical protein V3S55_13890 [Nitrospiraceae bacterium]
MKIMRSKFSCFVLGVVLSFALQLALSQGTTKSKSHQTDLGGRIITATVERTFAALASVTQTPSLNAVALSPGWHTAQLVITGSPTGCAFQLEGSLNNSNWEDLSGSQDCTAITMFHVANKSVPYVRGNLTALSGGTSPTVQLLYKGVK